MSTRLDPLTDSPTNPRLYQMLSNALTINAHAMGMLAAIGSFGAARYGGLDVPKPSAVVMAYTGHSDYVAAEPPTFVVVGENDGISPPAVMEKRVEALRRSGTPVEYHKYRNLGHGFGPGTGTSAEG